METQQRISFTCSASIPHVMKDPQTRKLSEREMKQRNKNNVKTVTDIDRQVARCKVKFSLLGI